jgi:hypothetical protein
MRKANRPGAMDAEKPQFCRRLGGWDSLLYDMCNENQIADVAAINLPSNLQPSGKQY